MLCVFLQWRYCIRLENLGNEVVQLRERHWRIFSLSGTLETVRGRGVVGRVSISKTDIGSHSLWSDVCGAPVYEAKLERELYANWIIFSFLPLKLNIWWNLNMFVVFVCRHRNQCCLRSSQPFSTAATCLYKPPVVICGELAHSYFSYTLYICWRSVHVPDGFCSAVLVLNPCLECPVYSLCCFFFFSRGTFRIERTDGSHFDVRIPPFSLESNKDDKAPPAGYTF